MQERWDVPYRQGVQEAIDILRGKWTIAVLATLALGEMQYKDLLVAVNEVEERVGWTSHDRPLSDRVFVNTLRRAEEDGLITRRGTQKGFSKLSWYQLTPLGRSLLRAARPLAEWAQQHRDELAAARQREVDR